MPDFIVTKSAMRPASTKEQCFYCNRAIGAMHDASCVLIKKKVRVRFTVEYEVSVPASWDKHMIEFQRNDGSWCVDNAIRELEALAEAKGCLCRADSSFEAIGDLDQPAYVEDA